MGLINLAHGSLFMLGAFFAAAVAGATGSFVLALIAALVGAAAAGAIMNWWCCAGCIRPTTSTRCWRPLR